MKLKKLAQSVYELNSRPLKSCWIFPNLSEKIECVYYEQGKSYENAAHEIAHYISEAYGHKVEVNSICSLWTEGECERSNGGTSAQKVGVTHRMMNAFVKDESLVVCGEWLQEQLKVFAQKLGKNIKIVRPELFNIPLLCSENLSLYFSGMEIDRVIKPVSVVAVLVSDSASWGIAMELCSCVRATYAQQSVTLVLVTDADDAKYNAYASRCFLSIFEAEGQDEFVSPYVVSSLAELKDFCQTEQTLMVLPQQKFYLTDELGEALFYVSEAEFKNLWGFCDGYGRQLLLNDVEKLAQRSFQCGDDVHKDVLAKHKPVSGWRRKLYWLRQRIDVFRMKMI